MQSFATFATTFSYLKHGLQALEDREFQQFQERFTRLQGKYRPIQAATLAKKRQYSLIEAPEFNIFRILRVQHLEDNTHSPFLAMLLNPLGAHGQGALFLNTFLETLHLSNQKFPLPELGPSSGNWTISREVHVRGGFLDIVIRNNHLGCLYVIENKINAPEQPNQIKRYQEWLSLQEAYPHRALIFLTPTGRQPQTGNAFCLSYQQDIIAWLESVIEQIKAPKVRATIEQYMEIISLPEEAAMAYEDKVLEFIGQPENITTALEIASYVEKLKSRAHWQFWKMANAKLELLLNASEFRNDWMLLKMSKKELEKGWVGCHLVPQSTPESPDIPYLRFPFRQFPLGNKSGLYYGIRWVDGAKSVEEISVPALQVLVEQLREQQLRSNPPYWPSWFTLGFPLLGDDFLVKMTNEADGFVNQLVEDFWAHFVSHKEAVQAVNKEVANLPNG